jgi:hypothetical protein
MAFSSEVYRWDDGHAASAAVFLADVTNKLSAFSFVPPGETAWSPKTDNEIDRGELVLSLDGYTDEVGNDIISPQVFVGRTSRQVAWLMTNRFNGGDRSYPATVGVFNQDTGAWSVYTCIATWRTSESVNNLYRTITIEFTEAEVLA